MRAGAQAAVVVSCLLLVGCNEKKPQAEPTQSADYGSLQPDLYVSSGGTTTTPPATDAYGGAGSAYDTTSSDPAAFSAGGSRTHVVVKGDTLYRLAREYYNDQSRWKDIYEANRGTLSDPNRLRVGQKLVIP